MTVHAHIHRILNIAEKSQAALMGGKGFEKFLEGQHKLDAKMNDFRKMVKEMAKVAGTPLIVGTELNFSVADGYATYYVTDIGKTEVTVVHVPHGDAYRFEGVYENEKGDLCLPRPVAERQCKASRELAAMFGE